MKNPQETKRLLRPAIHDHRREGDIEFLIQGRWNPSYFGQMSEDEAVQLAKYALDKGLPGEEYPIREVLIKAKDRQIRVYDGGSRTQYFR